MSGLTDARAEAAEKRLAELEAAVLALADEWDDPDPERGDPDRADALRALVSDPTALDRVRQEAVEAALAPIEGLYGGEPPPVFITGTKIVRATARRPDLGGIEVTESLLRVKDVRGAVAAARDAAKEAGR